MGLKLVLAEKPSVAMSIAKVIGASKRNDGFDGSVILSAQIGLNIMINNSWKIK